MSDRQLFVEFIAPDRGEVIALGVEEQVVYEDLRRLDQRRLAGAELFINFFQRFVAGGRAVFIGFGLAVVALQRGGDLHIVAEQRDDLGIGFDAERADKYRYGQLAVFVDADKKHVGRVGFIFQPRAAIGDDGGGINALARFVYIRRIIYARRAHDLRNDNALRAVDDKCAVVCHEREIAHENVAFEQFARRFVVQAHGNAQRRGVVYVALLAFLDGIFRRGVDMITYKLNREVAGIVGDGRHIAQHLHHPFVEEPFIGFLLHLDKVRHLECFVDF